MSTYLSTNLSIYLPSVLSSMRGGSSACPSYVSTIETKYMTMTESVNKAIGLKSFFWEIH